MKIAEGARVRIKVKLSIVDGDVLEQSVAEYFHGSGKMMPGLEAVLEGLEKGAEKSGVIPAKQAFDAVGDLPTKKIPRAEFPKEVDLTEGAIFGAKGQKGEDISFKVLAISDEHVEVRFVHPLAGKDIAYEVEVLDVTDPTPPPLPADAIAADDEEE